MADCPTCGGVGYVSCGPCSNPILCEVCRGIGRTLMIEYKEDVPLPPKPVIIHPEKLWRPSDSE